jgi:hypothetical protein
MSRDVSDCEILCHDRAVIPLMAFLQLSRFLLLKKQFDRIRSTVPVQFSSVFNFHQHPVFPSPYDRDRVCLLDRSSGHLDHLPVPDVRDFNEDSAYEIIKGQRFHHAPTVVAMTFWNEHGLVYVRNSCTCFGKNEYL